MTDKTRAVEASPIEAAAFILANCDPVDSSTLAIKVIAATIASMAPNEQAAAEGCDAVANDICRLVGAMRKELAERKGKLH